MRARGADRDGLVILAEEAAAQRPESARSPRRNGGFKSMRVSGADRALALLPRRPDARGLVAGARRSGGVGGIEPAHAVRERRSA